MNPRDYSKSGTNARKPSKKQEILLLFSCLAVVSSVVDKSLRAGRVFFWEGYPGNGISKVLLKHFVGAVAGLLEVAKEAVFFWSKLVRPYIKRMCSSSNFTFLLLLLLRG